MSSSNFTTILLISNINVEYINKQDKLYEVQFDVVMYENVEEAVLDEMRSFVQNKSNQRWLWLDIDHNTYSVLADTFGKRKGIVFRRFKEILSPFSIKMYYYDDWGSYERNLDTSNHTIGKKNT